MKYKSEFFLTSLNLSQLSIPEYFTYHQSGSVSLSYSENLPFSKFSTRNGGELWILGWMVYEGKLITPDSRLPSIPEKIEELVTSDIVKYSSGRYLLFLRTVENEIYLVPDGAASLSVFVGLSLPYCVSSPELALSVGLVQNYDSTLSSEEKKIRQSIGYLHVGGICGIRNLRLLSPNKYFCFLSEKPVRFWLKQDTLTGYTSDLQTAVKQVSRIMSETVKALSSLAPVALPITGGRDSRIILSTIYSNNIKNVTCFTQGNDVSDDVLIGRTLAHSCGYQWQNEKPDSSHICLPGFGGEIFKGYWYRNLNKHISCQSERIFKALPFSSQILSEEVRNLVKEEIEELTKLNLDDETILDLAYLEFRWAWTMGQTHYKYDQDFLTSMSLFTSREIITTALTLPYKIRHRMSFYSYLCEESSKHLLYLPAGIPHYEGNRLISTLLILPFAWILSSPFKKVVYSRAMLDGVHKTLKIYTRRLWKLRNPFRKLMHRQ